MQGLLHFLDTETASLQGGVVDLAIVQVDPHTLQVVDTFSTYINPERPIDPKAAEIHGIQEWDVQDAPTLKQYAASQGLFSDDPIIVAHNISFDLRMIAEILPRDYRQVCTLKVSREKVEAENHKLQTLRTLLGLTGGTAHRALGDVETTIDFFRFLRRQGITLEEMLNISKVSMTPSTKMTFGKHKGSKLKDLPRDYITWLLTKADSVRPEMRAALEAI